MSQPPDLSGRVCLVAGATRGAGRGIAIALGEAGATVYCSGRSVRGQTPPGRPETIEETAELVTAAGGKGVHHRCDHLDEAQVKALLARIAAEHGGLDVLINDVWGGDHLAEWNLTFLEQDVSKGRAMFDTAVWSHVITARHAAKLMKGRTNPLLVEITDGDSFGYRGSFFYDLVKFTVMRMAFTLAHELKPHGITALGVTPGFLRSEAMLELFKCTEATWRDGAKVQPDFICSETPRYVGRAIAHLAADARVKERAGRTFASWTLSREYGFCDVDGERPDWGAYFEKKYGVPAAADYTSWRNGPFELATANGQPYHAE